MRKTDFAGLTVVEPDLGDSIYADNGSFLERNPEIIDKLLRVGVLTHRHDGHAALSSPTVAPTATGQATGGTIPGATTLTVGYTAVDAQGGETILSPPVSVTTPAPLPAPGAPGATVDYTSGALRPGAYRYAISATDDNGGETLIGATVELVIPYGQARAQVAVSGMQTLAVAAGGTAWRLYRSIAGGPWYYMTYGSSNLIVDDGDLCADCSALPPGVNTTRRTGSVTVTVPPLPTGASRYRIYASRTAAFTSPSLVADLPASDLTPQTIIGLAFTTGAPPAVSTSVGGAAKIDPESELLNFHWRGPVSTAAELPAAAGTGDVRLTLDPLRLYAYDGTAWKLASGGGGGGGAVGSVTVGDGVDTVNPATAIRFIAGTGIGVDVDESPSGTARVTIANIAAGAGAATPGVRSAATATTGMLDALEGEAVSLTMGSTFALLAIATDRPARVRLYSTPAKRDLDAGRPSTQYPVGNHGLICEVITTASELTWLLAPMTIGADLKAVPTGVIAAHVENRSGAGTVTVTTTHIPIES